MELVVKESFSGNANTTKSFGSVMHSLYLANDGDTDVEFNINNQTYIIKSGEEFDEFLMPFTSMSITTTSSYRCWVRGER